MLRRFFEDCSGASSAEYALLLALASGIAGAAYHLSTVESSALMRAGDMVFASSQGVPADDGGAASAVAAPSARGGGGKSAGKAGAVGHGKGHGRDHAASKPRH